MFFRTVKHEGRTITAPAGQGRVFEKAGNGRVYAHTSQGQLRIGNWVEGEGVYITHPENLERAARRWGIKDAPSSS